MPVVHRLYKMGKGDASRMVRQLKAYEDIRPRLAFPFALPAERRTALGLVRRKKIAPREVLPLLRSKDFIERQAVSLILPKINGKAPVPEGMVEALKAAAKDPDLCARAAIAEAAGKIGAKATPLVEELTRDPNYKVFVAAAEAAATIGEEGRSVIKRMAKDPNQERRYAAAAGAWKMGAEGLPILKELAKDPDSSVRLAAAKAAGLMGKDGLSVVEELLKDTAPNVRMTVAEAAGTIGKAGLPILEELARDPDAQKRWEAVSGAGKLKVLGLPLIRTMTKDPDVRVRMTVAEAAGEMGTQGLPVLEELMKDYDHNVRRAVAWQAAKTRTKGMPILKELAKDPEEDVSETASKLVKEASLATKGRKWLLGTQKPFLAGDAKTAMKRARRLQEITRQLEKEFGEKFIGITVVGSTAKGYVTSLSDLDYSVIAEDREVLTRFKELAKDLPLCGEHYVSPKDKREERCLFYGLFFGNHDRLLQAQKNVIESIDEAKWDEIRSEIYKYEGGEGGLSKAPERFKIKATPLMAASVLLRVPPTLEEMRKIMARRAA
jgi:HEAT repeat protein/predicted nucleotidyltransferase